MTEYLSTAHAERLLARLAFEGENAVNVFRYSRYTRSILVRRMREAREGVGRYATNQDIKNLTRDTLFNVIQGWRKSVAP